MRRAALLAALVVLASGAAADAARADRVPRLTVTTASPLVVAGSGFVSRERVTVTVVTLLGPRIRQARATANGSFRVTLGTFTRPCGRPLAVRARGASGSRASVRIPAPPCIPPSR